MATPTADASATTQAKPRGLAAFQGFHRMFWVINTIELLERGAWYGVLGIFSVHVVRNLGVATTTMGLMQSLLLLLAYIVPLPAAALAQKFGYRATLAASFATVAVGYALFSTTSGVPALFAASILTGIGAGMFKPLPAAVVAQASPLEKRNFAYTIYYWAINLGAFLAPLAIGIAFDEAQFVYAFYLAGAIALVNIALVLAVFRNLEPAKPEKSVGEAFKPIGEAMRDRAFVVLLLIFSGFWFLYNMNWNYVQLYYTQFVAHPAWFDVALLFAVNPAVILLASPILSKRLEKYPSVPVMIGGMVAFVSGFIILGFSTAWQLVVAGIALASVGEFITYPGFLAYVSKMAPKEKVGVYLGAGMIPLGIGFFTGPLVGGFAYNLVAEQGSAPKLFWAMVCGIGLATIASMLMYNQWLQRRQARAAAGEPGVPAAPVPSRARRAATGAVPALVALLLIPGLLGAGVVLGTDHNLGAPAAAPALNTASLSGVQDLPAFQMEGSTTEGQSSTQALTVPAGAMGNLSLTLTWADETPQTPLPGVSNTPDHFRVTVTDAAGNELKKADASNPQGGQGSIPLTIALHPGDGGATWTVTIEALDCGDTMAPPGVPLGQDTGNAWTLGGHFQGPATTM